MEINRRTMLAAMIFRSLWNNLRITAWTLLTLATCAALVTLFTTITLEVRAKMSETLHGLGANAVASPVARTEADWMQFERAARSEGIRFVRLSVHVGLVKESPVAVIAGDVRALQELTPYWVVTGKRAEAPQECLVGRHVAESLAMKIGETVNIAWPAGGAPAAYTVSGIVESGDEDDERVFVSPIASPGDLNYALVSALGGEKAIARLQDALAGAAAHIEIKPLRQILHGEEHVLDKVRVLCLAALGAVLTLTALGVSASMLARVVERKKEFALLQALGAHKRAVVKFLLTESATVGGIAAVLGFGFGTALAAAVVRQIFNVNIAPHGLAFAAALAVTIAVALLAGMIASRRMLGLQPAAALKGE